MKTKDRDRALVVLETIQGIVAENEYNEGAVEVDRIIQRHCDELDGLVEGGHYHYDSEKIGNIRLYSRGFFNRSSDAEYLISTNIVSDVTHQASLVEHGLSLNWRHAQPVAA